MRHKIYFTCSKDIENFVEQMNSFVPDINLYYGHQIFDAKSIICLMSLQLFKEYEVELISNNEKTQKIFSKTVSIFGRK